MRIKTLAQWVQAPATSTERGELSMKEWVKLCEELTSKRLWGLAKHLGVTDTTIRNYMNNKYLPKQEVMKFIAAYCQEPILFICRNEYHVIDPNNIKTK